MGALRKILAKTKGQTLRELAERLDRPESWVKSTLEQLIANQEVATGRRMTGRRGRPAIEYFLVA